MGVARIRTTARSGGCSCRNERQTRHRRVRSPARSHPIAHLSTALVLLIYVLLAASPLPAPAVDRGIIEICTASGPRIVPAADLPSSHGPSTKPKRDCPLCRIHAALLLLPVQGSVQAAAFGVSTFPQPRSSPAIAGLPAGFHHLSRAPPFVS